MAKPFNEQVNIQPQTISTGQPQLLQSLSQKLDDFSSFAAQKVATKQIEAATIQGQQAGLEQQKSGGQLELKEETFIGGISKKAFNSAAREGYLKSLDNDVIESFSTLAADNAGNLQGYNIGAEALAKGFIEGVDPASRAAVKMSIDSMIARQRPKIQANQAQAVVDQGNNDQAINADERGRMAQSSAFEGDSENAGISLALAIDSVNNRTDLNDSQKAKATRNLQLGEREAFHSGDLSRTYDDGGAEAALDKLSEMDGNPPKGFTPDEWDKFTRSESKKLNRRISREKKQTKEQLKAAELAASVARGKEFTDPDMPADPAGSSDDRKDVNNYYDAVSQGWSNLPPQEQMDLNVDFVKNTGLVPETMVSRTGSFMRSGNVEQAAQAADYISRLQDETSVSLADIPAETRAMALQISDAQRAGMDVDLAMDNARKFAFGLSDSEKTVIKEETQLLSKELAGNLQSAVDESVANGGFDSGMFGGAFSIVPDVPAMMSADYRNSFGRFMTLTGGNSEQAQKLAYDSVKNTWAVSETGGSKRFMKYAPEAVYSVQGSSNHWIEEQFNEEMEVMGAEGAIIATDMFTAREKQPSYPVFKPNSETGMMEPLRGDNGENVTWKPDYKLTDEYKDLAEAPANTINSAKKQRAINLDKRANVIRRGIQSRVLSMEFIPFNERADFMASDDGKKSISRAINNMLAADRLDEAEAKEARNAFGI